MLHQINRIKSLAGNVRALGPLMGYRAALRYLVTTRGQPNAVAQAAFRGIPFSFRRRDISAVKEVLLLEEYYFLAPAIRNADAPVILDIGAHIGLFSVWALSVNPRARIHSVEASPETFRILSGNVVGAAEKGYAWSTEHRAAWRETGEISFMDGAESTMSHRVGADGTVKVPTVTLDQLLKNFCAGGVNVIKIDIEGAEEAFLCAPGLSLDGVENVAIEVHPALCDTEKVDAVLKKYFSIENVKQNTPSSKPLLYCRKAAAL